MKKLLALLLAALLLPSAALAQTQCAELIVTVNEENCAEIIQALNVFEGDNAAQLSRSMAKLMNGFGLRLYAQEDAAKLELLMSSTVLMDMTAMTTEDALVITSGLMEGYGLSIPLNLLNAESDAAAKLLEQTDWLQLLGGVAAAGAASLAGVEMTTARGSFSGDAYTGGVYCTTIMLDDSDVAALLSALMTDELRALLTELLAYADGDPALLGELDALHAKAAEKNAHRYIIRIVEDGAGEFVGLSAVIMQGEKQLATLSLGVPDDETLHIVLGLGMSEENYWYSHVITGTLSSLKGECIEFMGAKDEDFAFALAVADAYLARRTWSMDVAADDHKALWTVAMDMSAGEAEQTASLRGAGLVNTGTGTMKGSLNYLIGGAEYMTLTLNVAECEPLDTDVSDLTLCDLSSESEEQQALLNEIAEVMGVNLSMKLLQVIPMDLLMNLM